MFWLHNAPLKAEICQGLDCPIWEHNSQSSLYAMRAHDSIIPSRFCAVQVIHQAYPLNHAPVGRLSVVDFMKF